MKKLFFIPILSFGISFHQVQSEITNSLTYKLSQKQLEIYQKKLNIEKSKNYGSLDFTYDSIYMFSQPFTYIKIPPTVDIKSNLSDKQHFMAELKYSYPLFTGFAISNIIKKSELELIKSKLNLQNTKRILLLKSAEIYAQIYTLDNQIKAYKLAKKALLSALDKSKGFYKAGMLDKSKVDEIEAKYYEVFAYIKHLQTQKHIMINNLAYLLNKKIIDIENIESFNVKQPNFLNRADVKMIQQTLKIATQQIKIAKSKNYPSLGFEIALKKEGDNFTVTKNDYQNVDRSYAALELKYNLFDGDLTSTQIELAKIEKNKAIMFYNDYMNKIKTEYQNDLDIYKGLNYQLKSVKKEIKARKSYFEYIKSKFNEGLADSSNLNDAISKLAIAKAKYQAYKAQLFLLSYKLKLNGGNY